MPAGDEVDAWCGLYIVVVGLGLDLDRVYPCGALALCRS
jgi:hypothetical protein